MTSLPSNPVTLVNTDVPCTRCGYSLRGLLLDGKCPECGWPVEASLRGGLLRYAGPEYLAALVRGATIIIITNLANAALLVVAIAAVLIMLVFNGSVTVTPGPAGSPAGPAGPAGGPMPVIDILETSATALGILATSASLIGYWLLTAPDPATAASEQPRTARRVVRIAVASSAIVQIAILALQFLSPRLATGIPAPGPSVATALHFSQTGLTLLERAAGAVQFFAMMLYVRWLAQRVPDTHLIERTRLYIWLLPVLYTVGACVVGLGPLVAWVLYVMLLWNLRLHIVAAREQSLTLAPR